MGRDKYLLDVNGVPQYQRLYQLMEHLRVPVYISCSGEQAANIPAYYKKIVDQYGAIGPIGGIASAIASDACADWMVIACDLICLNEPALRKLLDAEDKQADVIAYKKSNSAFYETTLAIYKSASFQAIQRAVDSGQYSLQKVLRACNTRSVTADNEAWLLNANTPGDLEKRIK